MSLLRRPFAPLCLASAIGAVVGAAAHPLEADSFRSEAVVAVLPGPSGASSLQSPITALAETVELPQVAEAVAARSRLAIDAEEVANRIEVIDISTRSGLVRLRGSGTSQSEADALVDAVAEEAVSFVRAVVKTDFEFNFDTRSLEGWVSSSPFSYAVRRIGVVDGEGRAGTPAIGFQCVVEASGCGPSVELSGAISAGRRYAGRAFARTSSGSSRLRLVLGSDSNDVAAGPAVRLGGDRYRRLDVSWVPKRTVRTATLALQTTTKMPATFRVDSIVLAEQPGRAADAKATDRTDDRLEGLLGRGREGKRFVNFAKSAAAPAVEPRTWRWAVLGGFAGLVVCIVALGMASLARQRGN